MGQVDNLPVRTGQVDNLPRVCMSAFAATHVNRFITGRTVLFCRAQGGRSWLTIAARFAIRTVCLTAIGGSPGANIEAVSSFQLAAGKVRNCRRLPIASGRLLTGLSAPTRDPSGKTWAEFAIPAPYSFPLGG